MELSVDQVAVRFGRVQALGGVSLALRPGAVTVMVGPNGAGKSTLMSVLLGLVRPDAGRVLANGREVASAKMTASREFRASVGYLPEAVAFAESSTGRQVMSFFAMARGVDRAAIDRTLARVGLSEAASRRVGGYSRGMRQRLGLGIAILATPDVLVLDEPTNGLDQQGLAVLWEVLAEWRSHGRIAIVSTHELALIERHADQVCVLVDGLVRAVGSPHDLRERTGLPVRVRLQVDGDEQARDLAGGLEGAHLEGNSVGVDVAPGDLLKLMEIVQARRARLAGMRVQEPGLDEVYQHILRSAPWDA